MPPSFEFSVGAVNAGGPVSVKVTSAPCETVTVRFYVDGILVDTKTVKVPGTIDFTCPAGTTGASWLVTVSCPDGGSSSQGGVVG